MGKIAYNGVVIGVSAGGMNALIKLFSDMSKTFPIPIIVVQHLHPSGNSDLAEILNNKSLLTVKEAHDKEEILPGYVYIAPPDYHLLIEKDKTFSLSNDEKINYSRPSIDVMFESAAYTWSSELIGIILTGASCDGAEGMSIIKKFGGLTIAEDPATAEYPVMPQSAIDKGVIDKILQLDKIKEFLIDLAESSQ